MIICRSKLSITAMIVPIGIILFCLFFSLFPIVLLVTKNLNEPVLLITLIFLPLGLRVVMDLHRNVLMFRLEKTGISVGPLFKNKFYHWDEVKSIQLTGKGFERVTGIKFPQESAQIGFKNGDSVILFAKYYSNFPYVLQALNEVENQSKQNDRVQLLPFKLKRIRSVVRDKADMISYKNNHIFTFEGVLLYGMVSFLLYATISSGFNLESVSPILIFMIPFWLFFAWQFNYFKMNDHGLMIQNHLYWRRKSFQYEDIREVIVETPFKRSTRLTIITRDFYSHSYGACSLKKKTWQQLMEKFEKHGVSVRNEM